MAAPDALAPGWVVVGRVVDWVLAWTPARGRSLPIDRPRVARGFRHRSGARDERGSRLPQSLLADILLQPVRNPSATRSSRDVPDMCQVAGAILTTVPAPQSPTRIPVPPSRITGTGCSNPDRNGVAVA